MVNGQTNVFSPEDVWALLGTVKDPEIPVVSIVELGLVRHVEVKDGSVSVTLTPTFSGCPALYVIEDLVKESLAQLNPARVEVHWQLAPAWSSDQITEPGRQKLKDFGLAPPPVHHGQLLQLSLELATCPYCGSTDTELKNPFGPALCRSIFYCHACSQPFEQFKPI